LVRKSKTESAINYPDKSRAIKAEFFKRLSKKKISKRLPQNVLGKLKKEIKNQMILKI
jgi:hypothetical protein